MIEAVNSVIASSSLLRGNADQQDVSRSAASIPENSAEISIPKAPYISPFLSVDVNFDTTVLQIRDSDTGDVINQYPSESRLQQRQREAARTQQTAELTSAEPTRTEQTQVSQPQQQSVSVPEAQIASQALSTAAQTSVNTLSAGVSVAA